MRYFEVIRGTDYYAGRAKSRYYIEFLVVFLIFFSTFEPHNAIACLSENL